MQQRVRISSIRFIFFSSPRLPEANWELILRRKRVMKVDRWTVMKRNGCRRIRRLLKRNVETRQLHAEIREDSSGRNNVSTDLCLDRNPHPRRRFRSVDRACYTVDRCLRWKPPPRINSRSFHNNSCPDGKPTPRSVDCACSTANRSLDRKPSPCKQSGSMPNRSKANNSKIDSSPDSNPSLCDHGHSGPD